MEIKKGTQSGFTLVEVLVAVFILSITLTAVTSVFTLNITNANSIRNNFIASGLVQEGIELVKNMRDNDWHGGKSYGTSIPDGSWIVQWDDTELSVPFSGQYLKLDTTTNIYNYDTGSDSNFIRRIEVTTISSIERKVVVTVTWNFKNTTRTLSAENHLFDYK